MALLPRIPTRPAAILSIADAAARGLTVSGWIKEMKASGLSYRRTLMLSDWRNVTGTIRKRDVIKAVRKDRLLASNAMQDVDWDMESKYMYKFGAWMQTPEPGQKADYYINIPSNKPLTPLQAQAELESRWEKGERYAKERPAVVQLVGAWHRVPALEEPSPSPFLTEAEREQLST